MNRKRDDQPFDDELSSAAKKLKNPLTIVDDFHLNNQQTESHSFNTKQSIDENKFNIDQQDNCVKLSTISNLPIQVCQFELIEKVQMLIFFLSYLLLVINKHLS